MMEFRKVFNELEFEIEEIRKKYKDIQSNEFEEKKIYYLLEMDNSEMRSRFNDIRNFGRHIHSSLIDSKPNKLMPLLKIVWNLTYQQDNAITISCTQFPLYVISFAEENDFEPLIGIIVNLSSTFEGCKKLLEKPEELSKVLETTCFSGLAQICKRNLNKRR